MKRETYEIEIELPLMVEAVEGDDGEIELQAAIVNGSRGGSLLHCLTDVQKGYLRSEWLAAKQESDRRARSERRAR